MGKVGKKSGNDVASWGKIGKDRERRISIEFGDIRQIASVVVDIDKAMHHWSATLGIGPFHIRSQIRFDAYVYRGLAQPSPEISIALSNSGSLCHPGQRSASLLL